MRQVTSISEQTTPTALTHIRSTELRKTPVSREEDGTYIVSTYRETVALLPDPQPGSA